MWWTKRALWGLTCFLLAPAIEAQAGTYTARLRWQASASPSVTGYRVYTRLASGGWGAGQNAGKPAPAGDGTVSFQLGGLNVESDYVFAVAVYTSDGQESPRSNERTLGYAQVAPLVDSDGDGLTDAQEDVNLNRTVDAGESNPDDPDSDDDGRGDAADACEGTAVGAAVNASGCSCAQIPPCGDGNACNGVESCVAGVCQPGTPPSCNDGNACTIDSCNSVQGCIHSTMAGCSTCTTSSQCNDGNPCTADSCSGGTCQSLPRPNGTACGDGNACNGAETCQAGLCAAGPSLSCDDGNPCTTDGCSASSGCTHTTRANGASCGDGNACNGAEICQGGACTSGTAPTCNDGNPCTADSCSATSGCTYTPKTNGASCSDGNQCNGGETCQGGSCVAGGAPSCDDGDACTRDACDSAAGCTHAPIDGCSGGCRYNADCDDGNQCTADACNAGTCTNTVRADGTACNDGLFCTIGETCVAGSCGGGRPNCGHLETACREARCDESRHACMTDPLPNGTPCGEADTCTAAPFCHYGACVESNEDKCDDGNPCTADSCDAAGGCVHTPVPEGTTCADRDFCDGTETCRAGACVAAAVPECDDGNACTIDTCDARRRRCGHTPTRSCCSADADCVDDDLCTTNERCARGRCTSDPVVCTRGSRCELSSCDPDVGCQLTPLPEGSICEDGDPCTSGETCRDGQCVLPAAAASAVTAAAVGQTLVVDRFVLKPMGRRGTRLSARGTFAASSALDPTANDVTLEVRDQDGYVLYAATVPGSEFVADRGATRFLYWIPNGRAPVYNGLQKLLLTLDGEGGVDVVAKGMIPADPALVPLARGKRPTPSLEDARLSWAMHLLNWCWSDPDLECRKWRGSSRCR